MFFLQFTASTSSEETEKYCHTTLAAASWVLFISRSLAIVFVHRSDLVVGIRKKFWPKFETVTHESALIESCQISSHSMCLSLPYVSLWPPDI